MTVYRSSTDEFITSYQMWIKGKNPSNTLQMWDEEEGWKLRETTSGELVLWEEIDEESLPEGVEVVQKTRMSYPVIEDTREE